MLTKVDFCKSNATLDSMIKRLSYLFFIFVAFESFSNLQAESKFPPPKIYKVNYAIDKTWGKLVAVFDQPNAQRLTFENDTQVTIVQVGLIWDSASKTFEPTITQIIELKKGGADGKITPQIDPEVKMQVIEKL